MLDVKMTEAGLPFFFGLAGTFVPSINARARVNIEKLDDGERSPADRRTRREPRGGAAPGSHRRVERRGSAVIAIRSAREVERDPSA